jgi:hypothetical protein
MVCLSARSIKVARLSIFINNHHELSLFTVTLAVESIDTAGKPPAVLSIDLGINKAACSVLLTKKGYRHIRYWKQEDKLQRMKTLR